MNKITLTLILEFLFIAANSQPTWNVKFIGSGKYEVTVVPSDTIKQVKFKVTLTSNSITKTEEKIFTDSRYPELIPGNRYIKPYHCKADVIDVSGFYLTYQPKYKVASGYNFEIVIPPVAPSQQIPETGNKVMLEEDNTDQDLIFIPVEVSPLLLSLYPNIQPTYKDLDEWLKANTTNTIQVECTIINQPNSDGNYYYTAWGKSFFKKAPGNEGACLLITAPDVTLLYSDRYYTVPGNQNNLSQRFSYNNGDVCTIKLDMAQNMIISKSLTWNYEESFSDVKRSGNMIYGTMDGKMIVLNLLKK
jgi:hypothetical protein